MPQTALIETPDDHDVWDDDEDPPAREFPLLYSTADPPNIRSRLHVICALYAHTEGAENRLILLDQLEAMTLEAAQHLALELLEAGWRPGAPDLPVERLLVPKP